MEELPEILSGISLSNLQSSYGVKFDATSIQDVFNEADTDEPELIQNSYLDPVCSYPKEPFSILWPKFNKINETHLIRKVIVTEGGVVRPTIDSTVKILYTLYIDGCKTPIGHNKSNAYFNCSLNNSGLLPGITLAILSMSEGERSQFLIHYSLMYGDLGCPPIIPKEAVCLLHIILSSVANTSNESSDETINERFFLPQMSSILKNAELLKKDAYSHCTNGNYKKALNCLNKAIKLMIECRLANDDEENEQKRMLCALYLGSGICYVELNLPLKACTMFNEYHKISNIYNCSKSLYYNGKALIMIGNHKEAEKRLKRALKLSPDNKKIQQELLLLYNKRSVFNSYEKNFLKMMSKFSKDESDDFILNEYIDEIERMCNTMDSNDDTTSLRFDLPLELGYRELDCIKEKFTEKGFTIIFNEADGKQYIEIRLIKKDE